MRGGRRAGRLARGYGAAVVLLAAALLTACTTPLDLLAQNPPLTPTPTDEWVALRRPLQIPVTEPGAACATSAPGDGPLYPVLPNRDSASLAGAREEGGWYYVKVLWNGDPDAGDRILIRGHQIDGSAELRFGSGVDPSTELHLEAAQGNTHPDGGHDWPSYTRVRAAGCYAYQVDGEDFSDVIVFNVTN